MSGGNAGRKQQQKCPARPARPSPQNKLTPAATGFRSLSLFLSLFLSFCLSRSLAPLIPMRHHLPVCTHAHTQTSHTHTHTRKPLQRFVIHDTCVGRITSSIGVGACGHNLTPIRNHNLVIQLCVQQHTHKHIREYTNACRFVCVHVQGHDLNFLSAGCSWSN